MKFAKIEQSEAQKPSMIMIIFSAAKGGSVKLVLLLPYPVMLMFGYSRRLKNGLLMLYLSKFVKLSPATCFGPYSSLQDV